MAESGLKAIDYPVNAIFEDIVCIEVYKDSYLQIQQSKISPCLLEEDILKLLDAFQFHNDSVFYQYVKS